MRVKAACEIMIGVSKSINNVDGAGYPVGGPLVQPVYPSPKQTAAFLAAQMCCWRRKPVPGVFAAVELCLKVTVRQCHAFASHERQRGGDCSSEEGATSIHRPDTRPTWPPSAPKRSIRKTDPNDSFPHFVTQPHGSGIDPLGDREDNKNRSVRRIGTRREKLDPHFPAFLQLVAALDWIKLVWRHAASLSETRLDSFKS